VRHCANLVTVGEGIGRWGNKGGGGGPPSPAPAVEHDGRLPALPRQALPHHNSSWRVAVAGVVHAHTCGSVVVDSTRRCHDTGTGLCTVTSAHHSQSGQRDLRTPRSLTLVVDDKGKSRVPNCYEQDERGLWTQGGGGGKGTKKKTKKKHSVSSTIQADLTEPPFPPPPRYPALATACNPS
jgi:hypothetical protein